MKIMKNLRTRRHGLILAGVLLLALAVYSGWWMWLAAGVRTQIDGWVAAQQTMGRSVGYAKLAVSGYPGRLQIALTEVQAEDQPGGWQIKVPALQAQLTPWAPDSLDGHVPEPVSLRLDKGVLPGRYAIRAGKNDLHLDAQDGGRLTLSLAAVQITDAGQGDTLDIASLKATLLRAKAPIYGSLDLEVDDLNYPDRWKNAFGQHVAHFQTRIEMSGAALPSGPDAAAVRAWSNDGGAMDIKSLDLAHGVLGLNGEGTLALDRDLQPIGAFTARIAGIAPAIDQLITAGLVRPDDGALAKVVLGVMAVVPPGGGPKRVSLPLTLQDRKLSVGPIALIRLPQIVWD